MRILIVSDFVEKIGGAEIYDHQLKNLLKHAGHQVAIAGGKRTNETIARMFEKYLLSLYSPRWKKKIETVIDRFSPDLVFCHSLGYKISPSFFPTVREKNIPIVLKPPNFGIYNLKSTGIHSFFIRPKKLIHREYIEKYVDVLVSGSEFMARWLRKNFEVPNVVTIQNPIPWETNQKPNLSKSSNKKLLYAGRLSEGKGLKYLIKSIAILSEDIENVSLEIAGKGSPLKDLRKLSKKLGIENKINFLGRMPHEKLKKKYCEADMFCLPSIVPESFGLVITEAMSQGTPVVTTNIGGQKELVKEGYNGLLVNPRDSRDLAEKIYQILKNDDLRERMAENSLEYAKKFSPEKHIQKIEKLFEEIVE